MHWPEALWLKMKPGFRLPKCIGQKHCGFRTFRLQYFRQIKYSQNQFDLKIDLNLITIFTPNFASISSHHWCRLFQNTWTLWMGNFGNKLQLSNLCDCPRSIHIQTSQWILENLKIFYSTLEIWTFGHVDSGKEGSNQRGEPNAEFGHCRQSFTLPNAKKSSCRINDS